MRPVALPRQLRRPSVVRGLFTRDEIQQLRAVAIDGYAAAETSDDPMVKSTAVGWGGLAVSTVRPAIDQLFCMIGDRIARRWAGAYMIEPYCVFRRIVPSTYIRWHMDADGTGSWASDPVWNCWLPLSEVGVDGSPSLDVIPSSGQRMRRFGPSPPGHRPDEWVAEHFGRDPVMCPHLHPGDALVFSHWLLHRTQPMAALSGPRIGAEMRFSWRAPERRSLWQRIMGAA